MNVRRRRLTTTPLLVASAGAAMMIASCEGTSSGNLVAPAQVELCVNVMPEAAMAQVQFNSRGVESEGNCAEVFEGDVQVDVTATGYQPYSNMVEVYRDTTLDVTLTPAPAGDATVP